MLAFGARREQFEELAAKGARTPLDSEPGLYDDLVWVWEAFQALSPSRAITMGGVGAIPFEAIDRYAERYGVDDFEAFHALITAMDATYVQHINTDGKAKAPDG